MGKSAEIAFSMAMKMNMFTDIVEKLDIVGKHSL